MEIFNFCQIVFMYRTRNSMNNLLSYCGLVDDRISTSEKDLPVRIPSLKSRWHHNDKDSDQLFLIKKEVKSSLDTSFPLYCFILTL